MLVNHDIFPYTNTQIQNKLDVKMQKGKNKNKKY